MRVFSSKIISKRIFYVIFLPIIFFRVFLKLSNTSCKSVFSRSSIISIEISSLTSSFSFRFFLFCAVTFIKNSNKYTKSFLIQCFFCRLIRRLTGEFIKFDMSDIWYDWDGRRALEKSVNKNPEVHIKSLSFSCKVHVFKNLKSFEPPVGSEDISSHV